MYYIDLSGKRVEKVCTENKILILAKGFLYSDRGKVRCSNPNLYYRVPSRGVVVEEMVANLITLSSIYIHHILSHSLQLFRMSLEKCRNCNSL